MQPSTALTPAHFAFMRAVVQGLDWQASWERYLQPEGVPPLRGTAHAVVNDMRLAFASAARAARRPGLARLILIDPSQVEDPATAALPTLEAFAQAHGLADFSMAEQTQAYQAAYPPTRQGPPTGTPRRARIIRRQLAALLWLERHAVPAPTGGDLVQTWWPPATTQALAAVGVLTFDDLRSWMAEHGSSWTRRLRGIGPVKGRRLQRWLADHGWAPQPHAHGDDPRPARGNGRPMARAAAAATAVRPLEHFIPPAGPCAEEAAPALIRHWLRGPVDGATERPPVAKVTVRGTSQIVDGQTGPWQASTWRSYRREAERLMLWSYLCRNKPLAQLTQADCADYLDFLLAPRPSHLWCAPRSSRRDDATWRPFEGPLGHGARVQALRILRLFFHHLVQRGHVATNPWERVRVLAAAPQDAARPHGRAHTADATAPDMPRRAVRAQLAWVLSQALGCTLTSLTTLRWADLADTSPVYRNVRLDGQALVLLHHYRAQLMTEMGAAAGAPHAPVFRRFPQTVTMDNADPAANVALTASALSQEVCRYRRIYSSA